MSFETTRCRHCGEEIVSSTQGWTHYHQFREHDAEPADPPAPEPVEGTPTEEDTLAQAKRLVARWAQGWMRDANTTARDGEWTGTFLNGAIPDLQARVGRALAAQREWLSGQITQERDALVRAVQSAEAAEARCAALEAKIAAVAQYHGYEHGNSCSQESGECGLCSILDCRWNEPLHFHHDTCPAEYAVERERDDARAKVAALEAERDRLREIWKRRDFEDGQWWAEMDEAMAPDRAARGKETP